MRHCDTYQIPAYAVPYIANDDPTGLSDLEIELIDGFMAATFPRGCSVRRCDVRLLIELFCLHINLCILLGGLLVRENREAFFKEAIDYKI